MPVIPALGRLRKSCEFEASLGYIAKPGQPELYSKTVSGEKKEKKIYGRFFIPAPTI
jgi:hypothetical protein